MRLQRVGHNWVTEHERDGKSIVLAMEKHLGSHSRWSLTDCVTLRDWLKLPEQQYPHLQNEEDPISSLLLVPYDFVLLSVVSSVSMDIEWFLYQSASAQKTGQWPLPRTLTPKALEHSYSSTHILESIKTASYSQGDWEIVWMSWRVANPTSSFLKFKL